jgi:hypothetical protein
MLYAALTLHPPQGAASLTVARWQLRAGEKRRTDACMPWPPFFVLDLAEQGLLPPGWSEAAFSFEDRPAIPIMAGEGDAPWRFDIIEGDSIRAELGWLFDLYLGPLREFSSRSFGTPLFPCRHERATITLNILTGLGAGNDWHTDQNPVTALFYPQTLAPDQGGLLQFKRADGATAEIAPRAGSFVCFDGAVPHRVTPLTSGTRLAYAMLYFHSLTDQPFPPETPDYIARFG